MSTNDPQQTPPALPTTGSDADAQRTVQQALHEIQAQLITLQQQISTLHDTQTELVQQLASRPAEPATEQPPDQPPAGPAQPPPAPEQTATPQAAAAAALHHGAEQIDLRADDAKTPPEPDLLPNGVSGRTGQLLVRLDQRAASTLAHATADNNHLRALHRARRRLGEQEHLGVVFGVDEDKLTESRWAVIVNSQEDAALLEALLPLIRHRSAQQGIELPADIAFQPDETCGAWFERTMADYTVPWNRRPPVMIYEPGETSAQWLGRHGVTHGPVDPRRGVPFYLLIVGRPGALSASDIAYIPYSFQYELDMFWGVGRLCFTDGSGAHVCDDYRTYAQHVVDSENNPPPYRKHAVLFGPRHELDPSTQRSAKELVIPLAEGRDDQPGIAARYGFAQQVFLGDEDGRAANRAHLEGIWRGDTENGPPALFFSASHGIGLPADDPDLVMQQGALLCQDWTGFGNIERGHWYAGEDLPGDARVRGLIAVCFACYGAGCPQEDEFVFAVGKQKQRAPERPFIAPFDLVAQLPQRLLTRGALAVLGHVDRAWTHSFGQQGVPSQSQAFEDLLGRILAGKRMGFATDQFNLRQGVIASLLANELENRDFGKYVDERNLSSLWVARNDARNYALLGDPAVRLPVEQMAAV